MIFKYSRINLWFILFFKSFFLYEKEKCIRMKFKNLTMYFLYYFHNKKKLMENPCSKIIPYEPKPLLNWFVRLKIKWRVTPRVVASWVRSGLTTSLLTITPDTTRQSKLFVSFLFLIINICNINKDFLNVYPYIKWIRWTNNEKNHSISHKLIHRPLRV
jgi:hypothetical protein